VGGIKEKILAAHRAGIKTVILPRDNEKDLDDVPEAVKNELHFILVDSVEQVLKEALDIELPQGEVIGTDTDPSHAGTFQKTA
jgi:ATP-dependent Lon protease